MTQEQWTDLLFCLLIIGMMWYIEYQSKSNERLQKVGHRLNDELFAAKMELSQTNGDKRMLALALTLGTTNKSVEAMRQKALAEMRLSGVLPEDMTDEFLSMIKIYEARNGRATT